MLSVSLSFILVFGGFLADSQLIWPQELDCNTLQGRMDNTWIKLSRPMEVGDAITVEGNLTAFLIIRTASLNLVHQYGYHHISIHVRFDAGRMCYNSMDVAPNWGPEEFGPSVAAGGMPFKIIIKRFSNYYDVYNDQTFLKKFRIRHPLDRTIEWFFPFKALKISSVKMECVRPPVHPPTTAAPRPTRRPGGNHGNGHGHHHHHYDSSSSSSHELYG